MDKLTGLVGNNETLNKLVGEGGSKVAELAGGDKGESLEQTATENAIEGMIKQQVESVAGAKVAASEHVDKIAEQVADAVGDKIPGSVMGAGALGAGGKDKDDKTDASGGDAAAGLMNAAMGALGKK